MQLQARVNAPYLATAGDGIDLSYLPRFDIYGLVHKGLRLALGQMLVRMGQTSPHDDSQLQRLIDDLHGVLYLFTTHAEHEDRHLHRALEARHAGASARLSAAHASQEGDVAALRLLCCECSARSGDARSAAYRALYLRFASFAAENIAHMGEEESYAQPLFEKLYTTEELVAIHRSLLADIGPDEMLAFMRNRVAAANREQRIALLDNFQKGASGLAFRQLLSSLLPHVVESEREALLERFGVAA